MFLKTLHKSTYDGRIVGAETVTSSIIKSKSIVISRRGSHFGETIRPHLFLKWPQVDCKSPTWNQNDLTRLGKKATDFRLQVDFWQVENGKKQEEELYIVRFHRF